MVIIHWIRSIFPVKLNFKKEIEYIVLQMLLRTQAILCALREPTRVFFYYYYCIVVCINTHKIVAPCVQLSLVVFR